MSWPACATRWPACGQASSVTRRNQRRVMDRIYSRAPEGDEYPIEFAPIGPEDRGQLGRVRLRDQGSNGPADAPPALRDLWWLRCPWCREMIQVPIERLHVERGRIRIDGRIVCGHCETTYVVDAGRARRVRDVEGAGPGGVTSGPATTSAGSDE